VIGSQDQADAQEVLRELEQEMWEASEKLEYERAALLRDQIEEWKKTHGLEGGVSSGKVQRPARKQTIFQKRKVRFR
jgi:excinuclease ABC subunit B